MEFHNSVFTFPIPHNLYFHDMLIFIGIKSIKKVPIHCDLEIVKVITEKAI